MPKNGARRGGAVTWSLGAIVVVVLSTTGCEATWMVVRESGPPSALKGLKTYTVESSFDGLTIGRKTEAEFISRDHRRLLPPNFVEKFSERAEGYSVREGRAGSGADVHLKVNYTFIEPGGWYVFWTVGTKVIATLSFFVAGVETDVIEMTGGAMGGNILSTYIGRITMSGKRMGVAAALFVQQANRSTEK